MGPGLSCLFSEFGAIGCPCARTKAGQALHRGRDGRRGDRPVRSTDALDGHARDPKPRHVAPSLPSRGLARGRRVPCWPWLSTSRPPNSRRRWSRPGSMRLHPRPEATASARPVQRRTTRRCCSSQPLLRGKPGASRIGEHGPGFLVHDFAGTSAVRQIAFNDHEGPRRRCCGVNVPVARTRAVDVNRPRGLGVHRRPSLTHRAWRHRPLRPSARPTRTCPQGACERSSRRRTGRCSSVRAHPQARR